MLKKIALTTVLYLNLLNSEIILEFNNHNNIDLEKDMTYLDLNINDYTASEYIKVMKELENFYAMDILFDDLKISKKEYNKKLELYKKIIKKDFLFEYFKKKYTITREDYERVYDSSNLFKEERYDLEYIKIKNKKDAVGLLNIINTTKNYKELLIKYNRFVSLNTIKRNKILIKKIKESKLNPKILDAINLSKSNLYVDKLVYINGYYYIVIINNKYKEFNKNDYFNKLEKNKIYKQNINNIIYTYQLNKAIKNIKKIYNFHLKIN